MKFKKLGVLVVSGLILGYSANVYAELPQESLGTFETTVVTQSGAVSGINVGDVIYGFKVFAKAANSTCLLLDANSSAEVDTVAEINAQGVFIDEGGEATANDTFVSNWEAPYKITDGLWVFPENGACVIYHGVKN